MQANRGGPSAILALLALLGVLAAGSYIRVVQLGRVEFSIDEVTQYFSAQSLAQTGVPRLPSGKEYWRGSDFTHMITWSERVFSDPELAARFPATVFGLLCLVLMAAVSWAIGGPWASVWATALFAIFPELVLQSRNARFYTYQLALVLPAFYTAWRTLLASSERAVARTWQWASLTGVLLLLAARVQPVTLTVGAGFGSAVLAMAAVLEWTRRRKPDTRPGFWRSNPALQLVVAAALGGGLIALVDPELVGALLTSAFRVPLWAGARPGDPRYYHYMLTDTLPLFYSLIPASFVVCFARDWRLGLFLAGWFAVPLALHSALLPWKGVRFVLAALPGLFVATGIAADALCAGLRRSAESALASKGVSRKLARPAAAAAVALAASFAIATTPSFNDVRRGLKHRKLLDWTAARRAMERELPGTSVPLGASVPLQPLFYWGKLDFTVGTDFLEDFDSGVPNEVGAIEGYGGTPVYPTPDSIRAAFPAASSVFIAIDPDQISSNLLDPSLLPVLRSQAQELCADRCGGLLLYHWPLAATPAS